MKKLLNKKIQSVSAALTREFLERALPLVLLGLIALVVAYKFIDPAPPKHIVISTGGRSANYNAYASIYRVLLAKEGISLEIRNSDGDVENIRKLKDPNSGVDFAFVQDGIARTEGAGTLQSLGSVYFEPAWVICKCASDIGHLSKLKGKRIAIGAAEDGSNVLAKTLLQASGISAKNAKILALSGEDSVDALAKGKIDAMIIVDTANSTAIHRALSIEGVRLISLDDAEAYTRQFTYLHHLVLPEGGVDLARNIPPHRVHLVAPTTMLVAKEDTHPAIVYLMMKVISQVHSSAGIFNNKGDFPSTRGDDYPLSAQAANYYKSGPPVLDKYLPFWAATFVSRALIIVLPILAILIPLSKIIPVAYNWMTRRKILRHYGELRALEQLLKQNDPVISKSFFAEKLDEIERKVREIKMPISYSQDLYDLRSHIELVRSKL